MPAQHLSEAEAVQLQIEPLGRPTDGCYDLLDSECDRPVQTGGRVNWQPYGQLWLQCG